MTKRTWKVGHHKHESKGVSTITEYFVTDAETSEEIEQRATAASFPISQKFDQEHQESRAYEYADYMNKIAEATAQAYENNRLIDILKTP